MEETNKESVFLVLMKVVFFASILIGVVIGLKKLFPKDNTPLNTVTLIPVIRCVYQIHDRYSYLQAWVTEEQVDVEKKNCDHARELLVKIEKERTQKYCAYMKSVGKIMTQDEFETCSN